MSASRRGTTPLRRSSYRDLLPPGRLSPKRAFAAGLLADFDRYLERDSIDLLRDGVSFGIEGLWLDDAEFRELMLDLYRVLQPRRVHGPKKGRNRRLLASVLMPADGDRGEA